MTLFSICLFILLSLMILSFVLSVDIECTLTGQKDQDPYPSLSKCYRYNNDACCTSVHDDYINNYLSQLLTNSCMRKYTELEDIMCFGCHPYESQYIDRTTKTIRVCKSFALLFWNVTSDEDLEKPTMRFDNCGFKVIPTMKLENNKHFVMPSFIQTFHEFFQKIPIPFFEDYTIVLSNENNELCYNDSHWRIINHVLYMSLIVMLIL